MARADTQQALANVLRNPAIWRADQVTHGTPGIATTYPLLDQALPEHGWPRGALTELLVKVAGAGELSLLMPALRAACAEGRGIALLAPPWLPHARAWEAAGIPLARMLVIDSECIELLWAAEQILRSGECGAVVIWGQAAGRALNHRALQRLQLAANKGNAACFLYRSIDAEASPSPAPLRIRLAEQAGALHLHIVKCRGAPRAKPIPVQLFPAHWHSSPSQTPSTTPRITVVSNWTAATVTTSSGTSVADDTTQRDSLPEASRASDTTQRNYLSETSHASDTTQWDSLSETSHASDTAQWDSLSRMPRVPDAAQQNSHPAKISAGSLQAQAPAKSHIGLASTTSRPASVADAPRPLLTVA